MRARVWLLASESARRGLEHALRERSIECVRVVANFADVAVSLYDATGLLVIDTDHPDAMNALNEGAALVPVLAIAGREVSLPAEVMRLDTTDDDDRMAHHIAEILNQGGNVRRYPRVAVDLPVQIDGQRFRLKDVSMYGVWIETHGAYKTGQDFEMCVTLTDGAPVYLLGSVVGERGDGLAVRVRPLADSDLLLWLHLLLGELANSPIHADADVFGPLFR